MKRLILLTKTHFKMFTRNRGALMGSVLFPIIFIGIFGLAFQSSDPMSTTYKIGILNIDEGIPQDVIVPISSEIYPQYFTDTFIVNLEELTYQDNETKLFSTVKINSIDQGLNLLERREIYAVIVLDTTFSLFMLDVIRQAYEHHSDVSETTLNWSNYPQINSVVLDIEIIGDQSLQAFAIITNIMRDYTREFFNIKPISDLNLNVNIKGNVESEGLTGFDFIFPGLIIFGILQNLSIIAHSAFRDVESKILLRLKNSKMTGTEYVLSLIFSQLLISMVQIPIFIIVAMFFGFNISYTVVYIFIIGIILSLAVSGLGLITAAISSSESMVGNIAAMIATPVAFLSGAFFLVPQTTIVPEGSIFGSKSLYLFDLLAPTSGLRMLRGILLNGNPFETYIFELIVMSTLTVIYISIGIYLYSKNHLSPKK
jgi:ABC-2 type transport system permease protein